MQGNCDTCLHEKICALWRANECQDAACYSDDCYTPAADVAKVKHGYWVYKMRELIRYENVTGTDPLGGIQTVTVKTHVRGAVPYCSRCDALAADSFLDFCPRCGAKMDGKAEVENDA